MFKRKVNTTCVSNGVRQKIKQELMKMFVRFVIIKPKLA